MLFKNPYLKKHRCFKYHQELISTKVQIYQVTLVCKRVCVCAVQLSENARFAFCHIGYIKCRYCALVILSNRTVKMVLVHRKRITYMYTSFKWVMFVHAESTFNTWFDYWPLITLSALMWMNVSFVSSTNVNNCSLKLMVLYTVDPCCQGECSIREYCAFQQSNYWTSLCA